LAVLATLLTAFSTQMLLFGVARALVGIGFGLIFSCANAAAAKAAVPERAYSIAYGVLVAFSSMLPLVLGHSDRLDQLLPGLSVPHSSLFLAMALFTAVLAPTTLLLPATSVGSTIQSSRQTVTRISPAMSTASLAIMVGFSVGVFSVYTFIERRGRLLGMDPTSIGNMVSSAIALGLVGTFGSIILGLRVGRALPLLAGLIVQGASCVGISLCPTTLLLSGSTLLFMASWGFVYPYIMGLGAAIDPAGRLPTALGGGYLVGSSVAAGLGGLLMQVGGFALLGGVAFGLCAIAGLVALAAANHVDPDIARRGASSCHTVN
jgi:predicted MFS family arabinose efflux permease